MGTGDEKPQHNVSGRRRSDRHEGATSPEILIGIDEIRAYAGGGHGDLAWRTVEEMMRYGFPVSWIASRYVASRSAIDEWYARMMYDAAPSGVAIKG